MSFKDWSSKHTTAADNKNDAPKKGAAVAPAEPPIAPTKVAPAPAQGS